MGAMSIREFNSNISKALSAAEKGEDIVLTRHGKQVLRVTRDGVEALAELRPMMTREAARLRMIELMRQGIDLGGPFTHDERNGLDRFL